MAGLKDKRGFIDKERLDLSERKAVEYWMKRWGVTRDQITAAHRKVGHLVKDIAAEFGGRVNDSDRDEQANFGWPLTDILEVVPPVEHTGRQGWSDWSGHP